MFPLKLSTVLMVYCGLIDEVFGSSVGNDGKMILETKRDLIRNQYKESADYPFTQTATNNKPSANIDSQIANLSGRRPGDFEDAFLHNDKRTQLGVNKRFLFLNLKLSLNVDMEGGSRRRYEVTVPAPQTMGVFDAYVEAASLLRNTYPNAQNPFNLSLKYTGVDGCLQVVQAFGLESDATHSWVMDIRNSKGKSIFKGMCLPDRHEVKVGPFYEIALTYMNIAGGQ